ncbi:putative quinol monooxygenase [Mesorhizobium sp.]|uniref:putative quinol monooxygenase n=1 Tax=Mesorhizobium sp. TaxID=1871066 RepID=UPI000FE8E824|nr:putative quinol monooxygenase [Mesorhizobium sp.]RWG04156.1 MAG: antibiotic biosynthesis monooxygenase [Mesorhizobium sp.]RWH01153.1 MAG: antibiotic biosynthesis monooxygenase [Mesorhizobium sp.]RWI16630.1 MAG: antibiotic biosynthesis monooxygenase [Mesorhizobium sp.]RWN07699.1 MAG: antibiotic biosynthesis monooxygenase [Mesorhizobium sp.]RWN12383.1 MAG: antibiotic biosynthesis monooxygenase [Mesorhizobium sp.]
MKGGHANGFVVVVEFVIQKEHVDEFRKGIIENAATSLSDEPNCLVFDICEDPKRPGHILLYEVYRSQVDFDVHLTSKHFLRFHEITKPWVAEKKVEIFSRLSPTTLQGE